MACDPAGPSSVSGVLLFRPTLSSLFVIGPALLAAGCGCNQEYTFPEPEAVQFADAPPDFGSYLSFAPAPDDYRITMAYYDRVTTGLGFATGTPQDDGSIEWLHEQVDGYPEEDGLDRGDRGRYASHAIAADGTVWVAYQDSSNGTLKVAKRTGPNLWEAEVVDPGVGLTSSGAGNWASLALMDDGLPVVAHYDTEGGLLRVSKRTDTGWLNETAYEAEDVGRYADVAVHAGTVYIAFYNAAEGNLEMLEGVPGSWSHSPVATPGDVGQWPSLLVDDNEVLVSFHDVGNQNLNLARRVGGSWSTEVLDRGEFRGADTALFRHGGLPYVIYFDGKYNDMVLAAQGSDGTWSNTTIGGATAAVGFHNEVVQLNGRVFAGSYDHTNKTLFSTELFATR